MGYFCVCFFLLLFWVVWVDLSELPFLFIFLVASLLSVNLSDYNLFKFLLCVHAFSLVFCVLFSVEVEGEKTVLCH